MKVWRITVTPDYKVIGGGWQCGVQITRFSSSGNVNFSTTVEPGIFLVSAGGVHPDIPDHAPAREPWETFGDYCQRVSH